MERERSTLSSRLFGRVVLDANVLYPAALRDTLLRAAEKRLYLPRWSDEILDEVARNLLTDGRVDAKGVERLLALIRQHFPVAEIATPRDLIGQMTNASDDRHVLATAVVAQARTIVTANLRDFPPAALQPHGVEAVSPDAFLCRLLDGAPRTVAELLHEQAAALSSTPILLRELLAELSLQAPQFVSRLLPNLR